jgi:type I restriction enzyme M protein
VNQSDGIKNRLLRAADSMVKATAEWPSSGDHIVAVLFLRLLSDWYKETINAHRRKYRGDEIRVARAMSRERFVVPEGCTFEHLYAQRGVMNLGESINSTFRRLEEANRHKLEGVFGSTDFNSEDLGTSDKRNAGLRSLLETVAELGAETGLAPAQWIGDLADILLYKFAEDAARRREPFYTQPELSTLIRLLLKPAQGDRIYDPYCGCGALLICAARAIQSKDFALFGNESINSTWALCKLNLIIQGMDDARITMGDPLRKPILADDDTLQKFNVIVADPSPWLADWDSETLERDRLNRFRRGIPPKSSRDYVAITHVVESMDPVDGRACIVVPLGALFRGGNEGLIRRRLIEENLLDGVVQLPPNLLFGTAIPIALLLFKANRSHSSVFFINASQGFSIETSRNRLRDEDVERIVSAWESQTELARYSHLAPYEELEANEFSLHMPLYVKCSEEKEEVDFAALEANIEALEGRLVQVRADLASALRRLRE